MPRYSVYGSCLESSVEFPELPAASEGTPRWQFTTSERLPPMINAVERGAEVIYDDVHARLVAHRDGLRIIVDDTGEFEIGPNGVITVAPRPGAWDDFVRAHLLGRVLATALYEDGWLPLHGSAVETREGVIAFLAPKGFGKSSLALALAQLGAPLVTDDMLPIEPTTPPRAWPGVHSLRMNVDALDALGAQAVSATGTATREGKISIRDIPGIRIATQAGPLAAIFLVAPSGDASREAAANRTPYSTVLATAAVVAHVKVGRMLGREAAAPMLQRVATVVNLVPVHQLSITRDLSRLSEAAATILDWYGGAPK